MAIKLGCAWYPEHWPESRWPEDLRLMKEAGFNVVRVGEYAWSSLEPEDNHFKFDWLDQAVDLALSYGLEVVLGTPTSSPTAWITYNYPETVQINAEGQRTAHGNRGNYSPTSSVYQHLGLRVIEEMAKRYGQNQGVIGWQLDNECWAVSYDEECRQAFEKWLQKRYGTLEALNQHWSTQYWSQTYFEWSQIPLPVGSHNPGLMLDFKRFTTQVYRDFFKGQIDTIRRHALPEQFITHNCLGFVAPLDYYDINADLDLVSWDHYAGSVVPDVPAHSFESSIMRGFKQKNYWVMETQPGWANSGMVLHRGETRAMAWHDIGHGADGVCYWQWRSAPNGQEQYHGSLVGQDGTPRPIYAEIAQIGQELARLNDYFNDTTPVSEAALLHDYDSRWSLYYQPHHPDFEYIKYGLSFYKPLRNLIHNVDVISPEASLEKYRLVVAPAMHVMNEELAKRLIKYVEGGGHLVLGVRFSFKDTYNALWPTRSPGLLTACLGAYVEEYYALHEAISVQGPELSGTASIWAEWLQVNDPATEVLLRYGPSNGWLDNQPALVRRSVGKGSITYYGAWFDEALMQGLTRDLVARSGLNSFTEFRPLPNGVELCQRRNQHKEFYVLINHTSGEQKVTLPFPTVDLLSKQAYQQEILLNEHAVKVLERFPLAQESILFRGQLY